MTISVVDICRYPVKGLNAESLERVDLAPGQGLPHDRRFAIAHGSTQFDREAPKWLPKTSFFMLMRGDAARLLRSRGRQTDHRTGRQAGGLGRPDGPGRTDAHCRILFQLSGRLGTRRPEAVGGRGAHDIPEKQVSIINLASVRDLERVVRRPVHPLRFRGNIYIDGARPWEEFAWVGDSITLGDLRLNVEAPIGRCAATNVDPESGERDLNIPRALQAGFGHSRMGVYAAVAEGGELAKGDSLAAPG
jgi:uncharacterized protein YcbX